MSVLQRWQQLHGFSDDVAAQHLGLALGEFRRQRVVGPSRQTALIAVLVSVYRPDLTKIRSALADLARPPATSEEAAGRETPSGATHPRQSGLGTGIAGKPIAHRVDVMHA
jgi:hypothetical protein